MPDTRHHRGAHPEDAAIFAPVWLPTLRNGVAELSWLLSRGYAAAAALKLVGDHYQLTTRQRSAVARAACSDQSRQRRQATCRSSADLRGAEVMIDGFNLLITLEAALAGAVILHCRDGCLRDLASVHGSYRSVAETARALEIVGQRLAEYAPRAVTWIFDQPVSNSGQLAARLRAEAAAHGWPWTVAVELNPDQMVMRSMALAITSDSAILDHVAQWVNLSAELIQQAIPQAWRLDLAAEAST